MTFAVAILAHQNLNRVATVAKFLAKSGVHVAIHIDTIVSPSRFNEFQTSLSSCKNILWSKRTKCEWGEFSLVEATLDMSAEILKAWPDASHVVLISGDTLPVRPLAELQTLLDTHPETDFIESVVVNEKPWVANGLGIERFTLRFPFSWKKQRWLFDAWVDIQRKLRIKRKLPLNLPLHIGGQWWCLTRRTLQAILSDPDKATYDAYFQKCWIPDESYFQTLARKHSSNIESRSLVFSRFDYQGKPATFYNDHAGVLGEVDAYFARKIWHGADVLYEKFAPLEHSNLHADSRAENATQMIDRITERRTIGRTGLHMQGRAPCQWHESQMSTASPYSVFSGVTTVFPNLDAWLETQVQLRPQGRIFAPDQAYFSNGASIGPGGLSSNAKIRNLAPDAFLCNLVWNTRHDTLGFHFEADDSSKVTPFLLGDPNANIYYIRHSWVIELMQRNITNVRFLQSEATRFAQKERDFMAALHSPKTTANVHVWNIGEVLSAPAIMLAKIIADLGDGQNSSLMLLPEMANTDGLQTFGQSLKNIGIDLDILALELVSSSEIQKKHNQAIV